MKSLRPLLPLLAVVIALLLGALAIRLLQSPTQIAVPAGATPSSVSAVANASPTFVPTENTAQVDTDELDIDQLERLLAQLPSQSLDRQAETLQHLVNLVEDASYTPLSAWTTDARTPAPLMEILMEDLFNRDDETKLPVFWSIAENPAHPFQSVAADVLEIYAPQPDAATLAQQLSGSE